jgi:putative hydrolase of the HAD superfamily
VAPPKLVTFDLDDTLWDIDAVVTRAEARLHAWFEREAPAVAARWTATDLRRLRLDAETAHPEIAHDMRALRLASIRTAIATAGADVALVAPAFEVFWQARHDVELHADVLPALDALRGRVRLAAITNGNTELARMPLGARFEFALTAVEVGHAKPAPEIFLRACARAGVPAHEVWHVGDDPLVDVAGARAAGMEGVWLNRAGRAWPAGSAPPRHALRSLAELPGLLQV